ncbi:MAG: hypothetical protein LBI57_03530 [Helicobacteraceae bacterium]|nr:hypothetical protein [Helicobacteraceae bacterium]
MTNQLWINKLRERFAVLVVLFARQCLKLARSAIKRCFFIDTKRRDRIVKAVTIKRQSLFFHRFVSFLLGVKTSNDGAKYLFCRLRGGLNDMLCQIYLCATYALRYRRVVCIDGAVSGFLDDLGRYFAVREELKTWLRFGGIDFLSPPFDRYPKRFLHKVLPILDGGLAEFDQNKSYEQQVLFFTSDVGGDDSIDALSFLDLTPNIRSSISKTVQDLGGYDAIHIRHSDYETNYKKFFAEIADRLGGNVLLCTDSREVQQYAKGLFGDRLICLYEVPDVGGTTLHRNQNLDRYQTNLAALIDLFALANAKNLYMTHVDRLRGNALKTGGGEYIYPVLAGWLRR